MTMDRESQHHMVTLNEPGRPYLCTPALLNPSVYASMERFELVLHLGHPDMAVRYLAGKAILSSNADPLSILMGLLQQAPWGVRQEEALRLLVGMQATEAVQVLVPMLQARSAGQRVAVVKALRWLLDDPSPLLDALGDPVWRVRLEAVFGLSDCGRECDRPALKRMTNDPHPQVRKAAHGALRRWCRHAPSRSLRNVIRQGRP